MRRRGERGQITILMLTFAVCLILAVAAVTDIAGSYLRRQAATSLADGAALSASDAAAAIAVYGRADDDFVAIDGPAAADAVSAYLRSVNAYATYPGLNVEVTVHDYQVTVQLTMPYELPVRVPGIRATTTIRARSTATMPIY